jgi:hypothetical protein
MDSQLKALLQILEGATADFSEERLKWQPEGKWCAEEILEHLYLTYTGTIKALERILAAGNPLATRASIRHRMRTFVVVGLNYMPHGRKAPNPTLPRGLPGKDVRSEITLQIAAMDELLAQCEARFGRSKLMDHPVLGPLTVGQWRKFHFLHGRHHAKQIRRLRELAAEPVH